MAVVTETEYAEEKLKKKKGKKGRETNMQQTEQSQRLRSSSFMSEMKM